MKCDWCEEAEADFYVTLADAKDRTLIDYMNLCVGCMDERVSRVMSYPAQNAASGPGLRGDR